MLSFLKLILLARNGWWSAWSPILVFLTIVARIVLHTSLHQQKFHAHVLISEYAHSKRGLRYSSRCPLANQCPLTHGTGILWFGRKQLLLAITKNIPGCYIGGMNSTKKRPWRKASDEQDNVVIYPMLQYALRTVVGHDSVIGGNGFATNQYYCPSLLFDQHQQ